MKALMRFCMITAYNLGGETRHPQAVITSTYPDAENFDPTPIADAWFFRATPKLGEQPKAFSVVRVANRDGGVL